MDGAPYPGVGFGLLFGGAFNDGGPFGFRFFGLFDESGGTGASGGGPPDMVTELRTTLVFRLNKISVTVKLSDESQRRVEGKTM